MEKVDLSLYKGQTYQRNFTISDLSLEITQLYFTVKESTDSKVVALQKKIGDGITLMDNTDGVYTYLLELNTDDTENLKSDFDYGYDITLKSNNVKIPIIMGKFVISPVYTRKRDET